MWPLISTVVSKPGHFSVAYTVKVQHLTNGVR